MPIRRGGKVQAYIKKLKGCPKTIETEQVGDKMKLITFSVATFCPPSYVQCARRLLETRY